MTRLLTTIVLVVSLLAPFASGWAMAMGVADGRLLVICSGDGLRTIYINEDGEPTQLSDEALACVLKSTTDTAQAATPVMREERLLYVTQTAPMQRSDRPVRAYLSAHSRAPPMI